MQVTLTGNPFVDTGLGVLSYLSGKENIEELTINDIKKVHNDGKMLSIWNSKLKSISMVLTLNSLITNPAIKPVEKRQLYYSKIITALLENLDNNDINETCECCGNNSSMNIGKLIKKTLGPLGYKDEERYVGRDWFPLAGSLKSDAQALPASSRPPNVCAKCLFAIHYLPLGVMLVDGKLTVFQSTSIEFWYEIISDISKSMHEKISTGHYEILGSKEGSTRAIRTLLDVMTRMKKDLEEGVSLFIWRFSNAGTGPDCRIEEIPNNALLFLQIAIKYGLRNEIMDIISKDKKSKFSLLKCISSGSDYYFLYPYKKSNGVSQKLFFLYQIIINHILIDDLKTAYLIANYLKSIVAIKDFEIIGKDLEYNLSNKNKVKKHIVSMIESRLITFQDYYKLFKSKSSNLNHLDAWKLIKYYMHNLDQGFFSADIQPNPINNRDNIDPVEDNYMKNILYLASTIYYNYSAEKGEEKFKKFALDGFTKNINIKWLRNQFIKLAENNINFTYEYWKNLTLDHNDRDITYNTLYLLRLIWIELINKRIKNIEIDFDSILENKILDSDLSQSQEEIIRQIATNYIQKFGTKRFREVLKDFRNGNKGMYWIKERYSNLDQNFDENTWDSFLIDSNGNSIKYLRLFQIQLIFQNILRESF